MLKRKKNMKRYIGNVVVASSTYKVDKCYKKCFSIDEIDSALPSIIIGLENARSTIDGFNILVKRYNEGMLWWTFSKMERRVDHEIDLNEFYKFCINNIIKNNYYININIINIKNSEVKKYFEILNNKNKKLFYIDNNKFMFVYDIEGTGNVYGISLSTCCFFGIRKSKIINLFRMRHCCKEIKNFYSIPSSVKKLVKCEIPSEMVLLEFFK